MPTIDLGYVVGPQGPQGVAGATGATGAAGSPGPNQVTGSTSTTLNGILQGNGSVVSALQSDSTPTANSNNAIRSGAVYSALNKKINPNLIDNWFFVGGGTGNGVFPINQRGQLNYSGLSKYFDRWEGISSTEAAISSSGVTVSGGLMRQFLAFPFNRIANATMTLTVLLTNGELYVGTATVPGAVPSGNVAIISAAVQGTSSAVRLRSASGSLLITIEPGTGESLSVAAVKLEIGTVQSLASNIGTSDNPVWVLNDVPNYEAEIIKCQPFLATLSRYSAWRATSLSANEIRFYVTVPATMRSATPTLVNDTNFAVRGWGGSNATGFSFEISGVFKNAIQIKASKTSHGLTDAVLLANTGDVLVSAE